MNPASVALAGWVCLGLELGLKDALALGPSRIAPSFVFCLVTFLAMFAPRSKSVWTAVALGLAMDLTFRIPLRDGAAGAAVYFGPHALAYTLAVQLVLALRGVVIKRNPLTLGFLAMLGMVVAQVTLVAIYSIRLWIGDPIALAPSAELLARLGSAVYTGVIGAMLALVLIPMAPFFGLPAQSQRRFGTRT